MSISRNDIKGFFERKPSKLGMRPNDRQNGRYRGRPNSHL